jgi:hypothetical protein
MPKRFSTSQRQYLAQIAKPLCFKKEYYRFGRDNKFCQVLQLEQVPTFLKNLHGRVIGGHLFSNITMRKILGVGYWWLMMNQNVHEYFQIYDQCQRIGNMLT